MAPRLLAVISFAVCLLSVGDRADASWEADYNRAIQSFNHAEFESARESAEAGYRHWRGPSQRRAAWLFRLLWAESLIELDRTKEALPLLDFSSSSPETEARRLADLAMASFRNKQSDAALEYLAKALGTVPPDSPTIKGKIDLVRGMVLMNRDQVSDAESSFRRALEALEGTGSVMESYALIDLGFLDLSRFRYDEALYWFGRARDFAQHKNMRRALELSFGNLGAAYSNLGDVDRAVQNLEAAASLAESLHDRVYQVRWLVVLGETWSASGNLGKAAECYQKVLAIGDPKLDTAWLADALNDLSEIALRRGELASAETLNQQGTALAQRLESAATLLPHKIQSAEIAAARHDHSKAEALYADVLAASRGAGNPVAEFKSHAGLASLFRETGERSQAERHYRAATEIIDRERAKLGQDESKFSFQSSVIEFYRDYVDYLFDRGDAGGAFRVAESSRARVLEEKLHRDGKDEPDADLASLEGEARKSGAVLLSYWLAPKRSLLWVIDSAGLHSFSLPPEGEIASRVRSYNDAIQRGENLIERRNEAGQWLFTNLLASHYRAPKDSNIVIEPDGVLHQLNFESLPAGDGQRYWIEDATISIAPSLALLHSSGVTSARRLLIFGDPGFDGTEFQRLSNVKAELESVENHFPQKAVYVSSKATPAAYRQSHPEAYSTLHFATHAVANRESPLDSAIVLAGPPDSRKLYARDILQQPLTADLVTLSACQTAGSRTYYGEGLTGFSWAFLSAGARNVVAGLWDVDDRATASLMKSFYDELAKGLSPVSALRQSKLKLLASDGAYRKPQYWAAFETFTRALYR